MRKNFLRKKSCIAIDLGYSAVKGVRVCNPESGKIDICGIFPINSSLSYPYDEPSLIIPALTSLRDKLGAKGKKVNLCINMSHVNVREIKVPDVPRDELIEIIKWEIKKIIDFDPEEYNLDYKVIDKITIDGIPKLLVKVYTARKSILKQYVSLVEHCEMKVNIITIPPSALRSLILKLYPALIKNIAIIDLGEKSSSICVVNSEGVRFERQLIFSGIELKTAMEKEGIEFNSLIDLYTGYKINDNSVLDSITKETLHLLVDEMNKSFSFYNSVIKGGSISKIFITGGLANIKGIDFYIKEHTGIDTELLNINQTFRCDDVFIDPLRISVALGTGLLEQ